MVAREAMDKLMAPIPRGIDYMPEMHLTMGNHEERLDRFANEHPYLEEVVGTHMLNYADWGWKVHPFLKPVDVDGVRYCHYFISGSMGRGGVVGAGSAAHAEAELHHGPQPEDGRGVPSGHAPMGDLLRLLLPA
jgi:hypothetical protein